MRRCHVIILTVFAAAAGLAQAAEPPTRDATGDAACRQALERLHAQEEMQRDARKQRDAPAGVGTALEVARRRAAQACLGGPEDPPVASRRIQPPLSVAPVGAPTAPARPLPRPVKPTAPLPLASPAAQPRPALSTITSCDSAGCFTSDGNYLMRVGPNLAGPPGLCTSQAGILTCR